MSAGTFERFNISPDIWMETEDALLCIMQILNCSRDGALTLLDQFRNENPDSVITVALDS